MLFEPLSRPGRAGLSLRLVLFALVIPALVTACGKAPSVSGPAAIRLVDIFASAQVSGGSGPTMEPRPWLEWSFDGPVDSATAGWAAGCGVTGLEIRNQVLMGDTTDGFPIIHTEIANQPEAADLVHSVEVRAYVTEGTELAVGFQSSEKADPDALRKPYACLLRTSLNAGEDTKTHTLRNTVALRTGDLRHILLRPSDVPNAFFEVESVRVVTLKDHLAGTGAGVGWYGLSELYKESIVAKSGSTVRFEVTLQEHPWLDLALGTIETGPVTFRVGLGPTTQGHVEEKVLLERTVTVRDRWEPVRIDLAAHAEKNVALTLSMDSQQPGAVGFWGSPVLRNSGWKSAVVKSKDVADVEPPQGVILIMADSLRRDHLNVYGYGQETAPTLARMASEGALFKDCVAQASLTKVSTPSILTSLYPTAHTVKNTNDRLPSTAETLAEVYREAGYATLSMSGTPGTGQFSNLHQGFETLHESASLVGGVCSARGYVDRLLPWLDEHRDVPFFVFLHISDLADLFAAAQSHDSLKWIEPARKEELEEYLNQVRGIMADWGMDGVRAVSRGELELAGIEPEKFAGTMRNLYKGAIHELDTEIGRLVKHLDTLGLTQKTAVAFVGGHGEEFLEHGGMFHGHSVYGEVANVPLLIRRPGAVSPGRVIEATVQTIDVMPTLLEMSALEPPNIIQGTSLAALLAPTGSALEVGRADQPAVTELFGDACEAYAIIVNGWKLVHNMFPAMGESEFELYNHREDPLDRVNVAANHPDRVERLRAELAGWRERTLSAVLSSDAEAMSGVSAEELDRLQSLGYL